MEALKNIPRLTHKTISIRRTLDLPVDTVWKGWTECDSFKKWWGPKNYSCSFCKMEVKQGGKIITNITDRHGKETYSSGVYREVDVGKKLVFTDSFSDSKGDRIPPPKEIPGDWTQELVITVELQGDKNKTHLSLTHDNIPEEGYDDCMRSWNEALDKLENNLKWHTL